MNFLNIISFLLLFGIFITFGIKMDSPKEINKDYNQIQNQINPLEIKEDLTSNSNLSDLDLIGKDKKISSYKKRTNILTLDIKETGPEAKIVFNKPISLSYMVDVDNIPGLTDIQKNKIKTMFFEVIGEKEGKRINFKELDDIHNSVDLDDIDLNDLDLDNPDFNMKSLFGSTKEYDSDFNYIGNNTIKELDIQKFNNTDIPFKLVIYTSEPILFEVSDIKLQNVINNKTIFGENINMYNSTLYNLYTN